MSAIRFKPNPFGLNLAHQHRSAVSQASVEKVYEKIEYASQLDRDTPAPIKVSRGVHALRMGIDRIQRLGERIRENKNVAPIDAKLMHDEFQYLKSQLSSVFSRNIQDVVGVSETDIVAPIEMQAQFARLVDAVFKGDVSPLDRIDRIGYLLDANADPMIMEFDGLFRMTDPPRQGQIRTAIDTLSAHVTNLRVREALPINDRLAGEEYVRDAITRVSEDVLINATSAREVHSDDRIIENMALIFDDGYKSKV